MHGADERAEAQGKAFHLTANLFAVAFGLTGLAQAWSAVTQLAGASDWPGNVLWIVAAVTWLVTVAGYVANVAAQRRWKTELSDPTFGPFTALIFIVPMLLGARLAEQARGAGEVVFWCSAILVVLVGAWITGDRIVLDGDIRRWHPGYFLPTAAGGVIAGGASAELGFATLSHVLFGLGIISFVVLAPIISHRLFVVPTLPPPLLPIIAIDLAPSVAAGSSWFAIDGGKVDTPVAILGIHWLAAEHVRSGAALGYAVVGVLTAGFALLAARTVTGLIQGTFLPRVPAADQASG
jgi:tellurite resistance protein